MRESEEETKCMKQQVLVCLFVVFNKKRAGFTYFYKFNQTQGSYEYQVETQNTPKKLQIIEGGILAHFPQISNGFQTFTDI